jgi:hypothetical protein
LIASRIALGAVNCGFLQSPYVPCVCPLCMSPRGRDATVTDHVRSVAVNVSDGGDSCRSQRRQSKTFAPISSNGKIQRADAARGMKPPETENRSGNWAIRRSLCPAASCPAVGESGRADNRDRPRRDRCDDPRHWEPAKSRRQSESAPPSALAMLTPKRLRRVARQVEVGEAPATSYWRFGKRRRRNICAAASRVLIVRKLISACQRRAQI